MTEHPHQAQSPAPQLGHGSSFSVGELAAAARQWLQPPEFRIEVPDLPEDTSQPPRNLAAPVRHPTSENSAERQKSAGLREAIAQLATAVWRIQRSLKRLQSTAPTDDLRGLERHVNSCFDLFHEYGIEVRDDAGQKFTPGMALDVLAFQPLADISQDTIVETIRPSVLYQDELLQRGEVVVAVPLAREPTITQENEEQQAAQMQSSPTESQTESPTESPVTDQQTETTSAETEADHGQNDDRLRN